MPSRDVLHRKLVAKDCIASLAVDSTAKHSIVLVVDVLERQLHLILVVAAKNSSGSHIECRVAGCATRNESHVAQVRLILAIGTIHHPAEHVKVRAGGRLARESDRVRIGKEHVVGQQALKASVDQVTLLWILYGRSLCWNATVWRRSENERQKSIASFKIFLLKMLERNDKQMVFAQHALQFDVGGILLVVGSRLASKVTTAIQVSCIQVRDAADDSGRAVSAAEARSRVRRSFRSAVELAEFRTEIVPSKRISTACDHVNHTADRVASPQCRFGTLDNFDSLNGSWINCCGGLVGTWTQDTRIHANAIDEHQDLLARQPANER